MKELILTLKGNRPWSEKEETMACRVNIKDGLNREEFIYCLQDAFVAILDQENIMLDKMEDDNG